MNSTEIIGVGLMCGTSQDGLDIAAVKFNPKTYEHQLLAAEEIEIPEHISNSLKKSMHLSAFEYVQLNNEVGNFFGNATIKFIKSKNLKPDYIASHGITVFHQPEKKITTQIGNPASICAITGIQTVADFRTMDVALNGQGAPLVPGCDQFLYKHFHYTLNLGGFANISVLKPNLSGFDITVCNLALNLISEKLNLKFDEGGNIAKSGRLIPSLLEKLNHLDFYKTSEAKSLGKEWFDNVFRPILMEFEASEPKDLLRTLVEHIAFQIARHLSVNKKCLVSGGGAFNHFLIERIQANTECEIVVPSEDTIKFKEAICFAFLGLLRIQEKTNVFKSVTGSNSDNIGGCIYLPSTL